MTIGPENVSTGLNPTRANTTSQIKTSIFNEVEMLFKTKKPRGLFQEDNESLGLDACLLLPMCSEWVQLLPKGRCYQRGDDAQDEQ